MDKQCGNNKDPGLGKMQIQDAAVTPCTSMLALQTQGPALGHFFISVVSSCPTFRKVT